MCYQTHRLCEPNKLPTAPAMDHTGPLNNTPPLNHIEPLNHTGTTSLKIFLNQRVLKAIPYLCYTGRDAGVFSEIYKFYESNYNSLIRTDHKSRRSSLKHMIFRLRHILPTSLTGPYPHRFIKPCWLH